MAKLVPLHGQFTDWRSLLASVMERDDIEHVMVLATHKDGTTGHAHFQMDRYEVAWFSILLAEIARGD